MARSQVAHAFFLLKSEVYHFINNLYQHLIMKANDGSWDMLRADLTTTVTADLDHLRLMHEKYLDSILQQTLLGAEAVSVVSALREILNLCMDLKRLHTSQLFDYIGSFSDFVYRLHGLPFKKCSVFNLQSRTITGRDGK